MEVSSIHAAGRRPGFPTRMGERLKKFVQEGGYSIHDSAVESGVVVERRGKK